MPGGSAAGTSVRFVAPLKAPDSDSIPISPNDVTAVIVFAPVEGAGPPE